MDNDSVVNVKTGLDNEDFIDFRGDALICPCDVEIAANFPFTKRLFQKGGPELLRECSAIGYCEIGNAAITKGYNLSVQHVIFLPVADRTNPDETINYLTLHQALRNALTLAATYLLGAIAVPVVKLKHKGVKTAFKRLVWMFVGNNEEVGPNDQRNEFTDILTSVSGEFNGSSIKEIVVYPIR